MNVLNNFKRVINDEKAFLWLNSFVLISLPLKHNINSISIILLSLYSICFFVFNRSEFKLKVTLILIVIVSIYLLSSMSLFWTINIEKSTEGLVQKLSYLILPIIFILNSNIRKIRVKKIFHKFSIAMVLYAIYCLVQGGISYFKTGSLDYLFYHQLSGFISNMNAIYMSAFTAFAVLFYANKVNKSKVDYSCFLILSTYLILLSSKIIILTTIILLPLLFSLNKRVNKNNFRRLVFISLGVVFLALISKNVVNRFRTEIKKTNLTEVIEKEEFGKVYHWTGTSLRLFQAKVFLELLKEDKLYIKGYGIDASQQKLEEKYKKYNLYDGFYHYDFHNQYLQIFSELGFLGFLALIFLLYLCLKSAIINKDNFFLSFIILIAILCLTESYLWRQRGMVFFIMVTLLFCEELRLNKKAN